VLTQAANYAAQTNYTILTAGTRNSTTFAGVTASSIFLTPSLSYPSAQEVDLTLTSKPFNTAASTPNQTAVAKAVTARSRRLALAMAATTSPPGCRGLAVPAMSTATATPRH
jgi:hypothetical protein